MTPRGTYRELTPQALIGGVLVGLVLNMGIVFAGLQIGFTIVGSTVGAIIGFGMATQISRRVNVNALQRGFYRVGDLRLALFMAGRSVGRVTDEPGAARRRSVGRVTDAPAYVTAIRHNSPPRPPGVGVRRIAPLVG